VAEAARVDRRFGQHGHRRTLPVSATNVVESGRSGREDRSSVLSELRVGAAGLLERVVYVGRRTGGRYDSARCVFATDRTRCERERATAQSRDCRARGRGARDGSTN